MTTISAVPPTRPRSPLRHPRLRRLLVWIGALVATGLLLLVAAGYWMMYTHRGAKFAFERLEHALPGTLEVDTLIGSIWGPLEVRKLSYKSERLQITMDRMRVAWSLRALVTRRLDVRELLADNVRVEVAAAGEKIADADTLKPLGDFRLPLDIMIGRGVFQRVRIVSTAADSGIRADTSIAIDRLTMKKMAFRDTLTIGSLAAVSPLGEFELHGGGRTHSGYRADFQLNWTLHPPRFAQLRGSGTLIGSLDTLRVLQKIEGSLEADVDALVLTPARDMRIAGRMLVHALDAHAFDARLPEGRASGTLDLRGRPLDFITTGTLEATTAKYGRARMDWNIERKKDVVRVVRFGWTPHGRRGHLAARGSLESGGGRRVDLTATWTDLGWPLTGEPSFETPRGTARIGGTLDRWRLVSDAMVGVPVLRDTARMQLTGIGDTRGLDVSMATVGVMGGSVSGRGRVEWTPSSWWSLSFTGRDIDPGTKWPAVPGAIAFTGTSQGRMLDSGPNGIILVRDVSGTLREHPLLGHAVLGLAGSTTHVRELDLSIGPDRLTATGTLGPGQDVRWALDAPDLGVLLPRGAGALAAEGTVSGPRTAPRLTAKVTGDSIHWDRYGVEKLTAELDLGSGEQGPLELVADGVNVRVAPRLFRHVGLRGEGTRRQHTLALTAASREDSLEVGLAGGLLGTREWRGELRTLDVATPNFGSWSLERPAALVAAPDRVDLRGFGWHSGEARVGADAAWAKTGTWTLRSSLEHVPLKLLSAYVPPSLELDAPVAGTLDFRGQGASVFGDARLTLGPGEIRYPTGNKKPATDRLLPSTLVMHGDGAGLHARTEIALDPTGTITANLTLPGFQPAHLGDGTQALAGDATLRLQNLRVVQGFVTALSNTEGGLTAEVRLLGTTSQPRWTGDVRLVEGAADIPRMGLAVRQIELVARGDESGHVSYDGGMRSGDGTLAFQGTATVRQTGLAAMNATITGRNVTAWDTRVMRVIASPDLRLSVLNDSLMLRGELNIPRAEVREPENRAHPARPSGDVRFVGGVEEEEVRVPLKIHADVRVVLGDDIRVRAKGLDAKPTGSVLTLKTPGQPLLATGQLHLTEGRYRAYGQNLTIETGRLVFGGGPIANPGLDVRATRKARDGVTAGFEVHGTLEAPQFSVFSDPPMAEREALAYALLGRSIDNSSQNESGIVDDAANSLSLRGGNYVAGTLARRLGLDEASVESESGTFENSSLRLGAYLSPRVYVNYGMGILDQVSTLRIQYFLSRMWTLQAEAGPENRAQVLYTFERGRSKKPPAAKEPVAPDSAVTRPTVSAAGEPSR